VFSLAETSMKGDCLIGLGVLVLGFAFGNSVENNQSSNLVAL